MANLEISSDPRRHSSLRDMNRQVQLMAQRQDTSRKATDRTNPFILNQDASAVIQACARQFADRFRLTSRETQVLCLICMGHKNSAIASVLGLTTATVRFHLFNIHGKTNTGNKIDLVLKIWRWTVESQTQPDFAKQYKPIACDK